jgi:predicted Zn-dependent protease
MLMRSAFSILLLLISGLTQAKEYGTYDPKKIVTITETAAGKTFGIDAAYLDQMVNDLASHAKNYPPKFDTAEDKARATNDVKVLAGMLEILVSKPPIDNGLLLRAAFLNSLGHNLQVSGAADKANAMFQALIKATPTDLRANLMYGNFLGSAGKAKEALPYLEKALSLGANEAAYSIAVSNIALGNKTKAIESLELYLKGNPKDQTALRLLDAIRQGKIEVKKTAN